MNISFGGGTWNFDLGLGSTGAGSTDTAASGGTHFGGQDTSGTTSGSSSLTDSGVPIKDGGQYGTVLVALDSEYIDKLTFDDINVIDNSIDYAKHYLGQGLLSPSAEKEQQKKVDILESVKTDLYIERSNLILEGFEKLQDGLSKYSSERDSMRESLIGDGYDEAEFGSDTINDLADTIMDITDDIVEYDLKTSLIETNSFPFVENQVYIDALNNALELLLDEIVYEKTLYEERKENKLRQEQLDLWYNISFVWINPPIPLELPKKQLSTASSDSFVGFFTNGSMYRWMAGGDLYDSPRAGDVSFKPDGNLNTVVFLGYDNPNIGSLDVVNKTINEMFTPILAGNELWRIQPLARNPY